MEKLVHKQTSTILSFPSTVRLQKKKICIRLKCYSVNNATAKIIPFLVSIKRVNIYRDIHFYQHYIGDYSLKSGCFA